MSEWQIQNYGGLSVGDRVEWTSGSMPWHTCFAVIEKMSFIGPLPYVQIRLERGGYMGGYIMDELKAVARP